jgi:hypothetical protein
MLMLVTSTWYLLIGVAIGLWCTAGVIAAILTLFAVALGGRDRDLWKPIVVGLCGPFGLLWVLFSWCGGRQLPYNSPKWKKSEDQP